MRHIIHTRQAIRDTEIRCGLSRSTHLTHSRLPYLKKETSELEGLKDTFVFVVPYLLFPNTEQNLLLQWVLLARRLFRGKLNLFSIRVSDFRLEIAGFCFWGFGSEMISLTSQSLDFGGKNLVACGCSSNASFERFSVRGYGKVSRKAWSGGYGGRKSVYCKLSSMKTQEAMINGESQGPPAGLHLKSYSESPISSTKLFEVVADDLLTLNKNLQSIVGAENPVLMSAAEQIFSAGGKRMRPALVFLVARATAELVGLKDLTVKHRRLAEIIEMIHTASLIHDDVLDESDLRRGKETVHQLFGTRVAVLAGDFMFAQSSWYLANLENIEVIKLISQVIKDFASGEIKQASSLFDCDVQLEEYLIKSYYKTASLMAASTKGAAIFSGSDHYITEKMYEYGKNLGLSFQVVDDILDFTQSAEQLGKPAGSDLAKGNLTAPVIFALEKESKLRDIIESEFSETGSLDEAIELVKSSGGIEKAQELARDKADVAIQNLQCLPHSMFRLALEDMVAYNLQRIA